MQDNILSNEETVEVESSDVASEEDVQVVGDDYDEFEPVEIVNVVTGFSGRTVIDVDDGSEYVSVGNSTPSLPSGRTTPALSSGRTTPALSSGRSTPELTDERESVNDISGAEEGEESDMDIPADEVTSEEVGTNFFSGKYCTGFQMKLTCTKTYRQYNPKYLLHHSHSYQK